MAAIILGRTMKKLYKNLLADGYNPSEDKFNFEEELSYYEEC